MNQLSISEVFPTVGKPTITYIERQNGEHEKKLAQSLRTDGQICLLTGPSKLGKTSLYKQVIPDLKRKEIVVRCTKSLTPRNFWANALEELNFEQIAEISSSWKMDVCTKIGIKGEFGWSWLAKLNPFSEISISGSNEKQIKREVIRSDLSAKHIVPILKELPLQLVVEDFHYLSEDVKVEIFQQWKYFVDEGVSVLVVSTSHHAGDIARSNPDLTGRIRLIDVGQWSKDDLEKIVKKGFDYFRLKNGSTFKSYIARESVGIPIITQQICQEFVSGLDLSTYSIDSRRDYQPQNVEPTISKVAKDYYGNFQRDFERLIEGPRSNSRKYDTYGKILGSFALEPIRFSLAKADLIDRVNVLCEGKEKIPLASIHSSLKALGPHQSRMKTVLLEWLSHSEMLHIVEPTFLFYLRQKIKSDGEPGSGREIDILVQLLKELRRASSL